MEPTVPVKPPLVNNESASLMRIRQFQKDGVVGETIGFPTLLAQGNTWLATQLGPNLGKIDICHIYNLWYFVYKRTYEFLYILSKFGVNVLLL